MAQVLGLRSAGLCRIGSFDALFDQARRRALAERKKEDRRVIGWQLIVQIRAILHVNSRLVHPHEPIGRMEARLDESHSQKQEEQQKWAEDIAGRPLMRECLEK